MPLGRKVLLIDNNLMDVLASEEALKGAGFEVERLTSPAGAVAKLEYVNPDFVLLDITMPRLNADEFLQNVRLLPRDEETVVVLFSALDADLMQQMCVDNDIHGYFCKSMGIPKVGEFLERFIG